MTYEVHLDVYDGPFDLLLQLITAQQVDVYEVSLSEVVDAFCAEIARNTDLDLERATQFLLIAATLVELKCRRLLPNEDDPELDEELSIFEARDYLLARLVECRMFTEAAAALNRLEQVASLSFPRSVGPDEDFAPTAPDLLAGVTAEKIAALAAKALSERPVPVVASDHLHYDEITVGELLDELVTTLPTAGPITLRALTIHASPSRIVACFLALLELYKEELVELDQFESFGELTVTWTGPGVGGSDGVAGSIGQHRPTGEPDLVGLIAADRYDQRADVSL